MVIVGKLVKQLPERTWLTLQTDIDAHWVLDEPIIIGNHSCDPNCGLQANEFDGYNVVAMRTIEVGEEITYDYSMVEWISIAVPECHCGTALCRGKSLGGKYLSPELLKKYEGFLAPYYSKLL